MSMVHIHPTALVDKTVQLGDGVTVGPYSIIQGRVQIGHDTRIGPHVIIKDFTTIGNKCEIFQFAVIGEVPQDLKFRGEETQLIIGDGNIIREFATIHRGTDGGGGVTRIGHGNLFMAYTHVAHDCVIGNKAIMANVATLAGHVEIGDHVNLGGLVAVHQYCRIGAHTYVGGLSGISLDVPPFVIIAGTRNRMRISGLNKIGMRRGGMSRDSINKLDEAFRIIFRSPQLLLNDALVKVKQEIPDCPEVDLLVEFFQTSKRGVVKRTLED